jgi:hypothetical protein
MLIYWVSKLFEIEPDVSETGPVSLLSGNGRKTYLQSGFSERANLSSGSGQGDQCS